MVQATGKDSTWSSFWRDVPGTTSWEETKGQTQVGVEKLYLWRLFPQSELVDVAR